MCKREAIQGRGLGLGLGLVYSSIISIVSIISYVVYKVLIPLLVIGIRTLPAVMLFTILRNGALREAL
jgi:hypothetical protein